jgi:hypothetical protein
MNLGEEYRWNIRTITYGFDPSFRNYFGERGMEEVRKAMAMLNALPPFSKMSTNLEEFSLDTRRHNQTASALLIRDMKSHALGAVIEQLGLTAPERYTWTLRDRVEVAPDINYWVIMRNFEPVPGSVSSYRPSKFVNGVLYTYGIFEFVNPDVADAVEFPVDPANPTHTTVASHMNGLFSGFLNTGEFFTGLTRDDVAGLRYLYRAANYNVESLTFSNIVSSGGVPWTPVGGGGFSNLVNTALRPGVDKLVFVEGKYESEFGTFRAITNSYSDYYVTNNTVRKQTIRSALVQPDIIFGAQDLGPVTVILRTGIADWQNNSLVNGDVEMAGPGVCTFPQFIIFNKLGPFLLNFNGGGSFQFEEGAFNAFSYVWGAFDGTTNAPVVFPEGSSLEDLEQRVLGH